MANKFCFREPTSCRRWHVCLMALYLHRPRQKDSFQNVALLETIWDRGTELYTNMCREENVTSEVDNIRSSAIVTKESENETAKLSHTQNWLNLGQQVYSCEANVCSDNSLFSVKPEGSIVFKRSPMNNILSQFNPVLLNVPPFL
jgi:hypothetical protein